MQAELSSGESILLDLGNHYVGHFSAEMEIVDDFIDAPVRLIFRFGEDKREIESNFSEYNGGLSDTWLQEEIHYADIPGEIKLPRRYACRYIKITVDKATRKIRLKNFRFLSQTCADISALKEYKNADETLDRIDKVSLNTLKECMQTFFEDGPKRDRRLWIGDLRLEALTNYYSFDNREITKRCLYLFAAGERNKNGFLPSFIYETPFFYSGKDHITDYALLYTVCVCDYFEHTGDKETVLDLLSICKAQLDGFYNILDERGIVIKQDGWFAFIDWCQGLNKRTSLHGVYAYALEKFIALLEALGDDDADLFKVRYDSNKKSALKWLYNADKGLFVNEADEYQLSVQSQVWMILGGIIEGEEAVSAINKTLDNKNALQPFTPYMRHYVIEAMLKLGMKEQALSYIKKIWGGMLELGADTFYEVFVPGDPDFSPYGDRMINSLCHAWSCSPSYFIRKYFK